jgi:hypothetical protein
MWNDFAAQMPTSLVPSSLLDASGRAVRASDVTRGESGGLSVYSRRRDRWATFLLHGPGGPLVDGATVFLQAHNGRYWEASSSQGLAARATRPSAAAAFTLRRLAGPGTIVSGDAITLEAADGSFLRGDGSTEIGLGAVPSPFTVVYDDF